MISPKCSHRAIVPVPFCLTSALSKFGSALTAAALRQTRKMRKTNGENRRADLARTRGSTSREAFSTSSYPPTRLSVIGAPNTLVAALIPPQERVLALASSARGKSADVTAVTRAPSTPTCQPEALVRDLRGVPDSLSDDSLARRRRHFGTFGQLRTARINDPAWNFVCRACWIFRRARRDHFVISGRRALEIGRTIRRRKVARTPRGVCVREWMCVYVRGDTIIICRLSRESNAALSSVALVCRSSICLAILDFDIAPYDRWTNSIADIGY